VGRPSCAAGPPAPTPAPPPPSPPHPLRRPQHAPPPPHRLRSPRLPRGGCARPPSLPHVEPQAQAQPGPRRRPSNRLGPRRRPAASGRVAGGEQRRAHAVPPSPRPRVLPRRSSELTSTERRRATDARTLAPWKFSAACRRGFLRT